MVTKPLVAVVEEQAVLLLTAVTALSTQVVEAMVVVSMVAEAAVAEKVVVVAAEKVQNKG